jgi:7,8-dihydropterin-6-yl-methyl-4-(beta-D-ribofuranosyl)aminobenzene 5'-phosphate synthase
MKIIVLSENTVSRNDLESEHGLSFYIETSSHKILFDTGASEIFYRNALKMGINIENVDIVVLSHGHYDHGGGIKKFLEVNKVAKVYMREGAFNPNYSQRENNLVYIGLDKSIENNDRIVYTSNNYIIDDSLELFSGVKDRELFSQANSAMKIIKNDIIEEDKFSHEQNLIIEENGKNVLFCGCAHCGIINIMNKYHYEKMDDPVYVFGGFHLYNPSSGKTECEDMIDKVGYKLRNTNTVFFTCHCTGNKAYSILKNILKDNIHYISAGNVIDLTIK